MGIFHNRGYRAALRSNKADPALLTASSPACRLSRTGKVLDRNQAFTQCFSAIDDLKALGKACSLPADAVYRLYSSLLRGRSREESNVAGTLRLVAADKQYYAVFDEVTAFEPATPTVAKAEAPPPVATLPAHDMHLAGSLKMQAIGQLAGGIAHDFNNLLTAILGFCDLLLLRHDIHDPSFADIEQIRQNARRGAELVRQLLAFSRRQTLQVQVTSLNDILHDLAATLPRLLGGGITPEFFYSTDLPPVLIDRSQFEQVVINLAVNARDALLEAGCSNGVLKLRTEFLSADEVKATGNKLLPYEPFVRFSVADNGPGIPQAIANQIFEPFFTTKEQGKGTGLGLSTVYGIVKQSQGFIFVEPAPGGGAMFTIYLPPAAAGATPEAAQKAPIQQDLSGRGTILLVEDELSVRTFALRALQTRGYTVHAADNAEEALTILHQQPIDLMISDVVMPGTDGPTLLQEVRKTHPQLKVILMSGYAEDAFKKHLAADEKFVFLPKPFSLNRLSETVKKVLSETE